MSGARAALRLRGRGRWKAREASRGRRRPFPRLPLRTMLVAAVVAFALGGAWLWFRDSSFVRVQDVFITGVTSAEEPRIRSALRAAARDMTTLHVREDALREAVAPFASVRDLRVDAGFPHKLTIEVIENGAVATLVTGGRRVAVADDGRVLRGGRVEPGLPTIRVERTPSARVSDRQTLSALTVLGVAPIALRRRVTRAWDGPRGLTLDLRAGPDLIFGGADRSEAKWIAAARVLADPSAAGATYLDLRVPERVAAGGLAPAEAKSTEDGADAQGAGQQDAGAGQTGAGQPGTGQPDAGQPGAGQPGAGQQGAGQPENGAGPTAEAPPATDGGQGGDP